MNEEEARAVFNNIKPSILDVIKECKPDYIGAQDMFEKMMTVGTEDTDFSLERMSALYHGISKQIPQKPINIGALEEPVTLGRGTFGKGTTILEKCPVCGAWVNGVRKVKYCDTCGQALDWGGEQDGNA